MIGSNILHKYGKEIEERLRLKTFPLAVKLLEKKGDIPEGAKRPKRDLGYCINACQAFSMARRGGEIIAMLKEDMWCPEPVIGYGLAEPPEYFLQGHNRFPESARTLEAGRHWAEALPCLEYGRYIGIVSAPLKTANFEPDLAMIYCNPAQLTQLLVAINWKDGHDLTCRLSGHAACVYSIVPVIHNARFQVTSPCVGDRVTAMASDDELIFTALTDALEDLVLGLRYLDKYNSRLPREPWLRYEGELPDSYAKIARMMGMELDK